MIRALLVALLAASWPAPGPGHAPYAAGGGGGLTIVQGCTDVNTTTAGACAFGSDVTSGNLVLCTFSSEANGTATIGPGSSGTATLSAWTERANATDSSHGDCEINTAAITGTGSLTVTWTYSSGPWNVGACYELSGGQIGASVTDEDNDTPQTETLTLSFSGSYVFGALSDWGATGAITTTSTPATTNVANQHDGAHYSTAHFRTTSTISSNPTIGQASPSAPGSGESLCLTEIGPS